MPMCTQNNLILVFLCVYFQCDFPKQVEHFQAECTAACTSQQTTRPSQSEECLGTFKVTSCQPSNASSPFSYTHDTEHCQCMKTIILNHIHHISTYNIAGASNYICECSRILLKLLKGCQEICHMSSFFCHLSYCPNLHANFTITPSNEPDLTLIQRSGVCEHHPQLGQGH